MDQSAPLSKDVRIKVKLPSDLRAAVKALKHARFHERTKLHEGEREVCLRTVSEAFTYLAERGLHLTTANIEACIQYHLEQQAIWQTIVSFFHANKARAYVTRDLFPNDAHVERFFDDAFGGPEKGDGRIDLYQAELRLYVAQVYLEPLLAAKDALRKALQNPVIANTWTPDFRGSMLC